MRQSSDSCDTVMRQAWDSLLLYSSCKRCKHVCSRPFNETVSQSSSDRVATWPWPDNLGAMEKNSNRDETHKHKLWWNSQTQIMMKLKNSNCDETPNLKLWWNSKTQIVMKLKNLECDKTQKLKFWQNSRTLNVTKLNTQIVTKLKLWQN